jgi:predicted MPP superfamily phosphohydrolase
MYEKNDCDIKMDNSYNSMKQFENIANEIYPLVNEWESKLLSLPEEMITERRNSQNRNIKQIVGHLVDSASNNTHRVVHLQYRDLPLRFPNYATYGNNDKWIAIQNYQEENWENLVMHMKFSMLHFAHIIQNINPETLQNEWLSDVGEKLTLKKMVEGFLPHFKLHLTEIEELIQAPPQPSPIGRK